MGSILLHSLMEAAWNNDTAPRRIYIGNGDPVKRTSIIEMHRGQVKMVNVNESLSCKALLESISTYQWLIEDLIHHMNYRLMSYRRGTIGIGSFNIDKVHTRSN